MILDRSTLLIACATVLSAHVGAWLQQAMGALYLAHALRSYRRDIGGQRRSVSTGQVARRTT